MDDSKDFHFCKFLFKVYFKGVCMCVNTCVHLQSICAQNSRCQERPGDGGVKAHGPRVAGD